MSDHKHASDENDQENAKPSLRPSHERTIHPLGREKANHEAKVIPHLHLSLHMLDLTDPLELETELHRYAFAVERNGHLSANCTNPPNAKRSRPGNDANVIFDMTPWADDFRQWREAQALGDLDPGLSSGPHLK